MEHQSKSMNLEKQHFSSSKSMLQPESHSPQESTSSAQPPPYDYPSQSPPLSGMPYPQYYQPVKPSEGYPQPYGAPSGGQPYYPQPGVVFPGPPVPNYQPPQSQQQQQQVDMMNNQMNGAPYIVVGQSSVPMAGAVFLSCVVFWCCGCVFGGIAFILAIVGQSSAAAGDSRSAIQMRNASYGLSIAGIVSGIIIIAVVAGIYGSRYKASNHCYDAFYGYYYC